MATVQTLKNQPIWGGETHWNTQQKKPAPNLLQLQFVMLVIIVKYFFMFTASNDQ